MVLGILGSLLAFFVMVTKRLFATLRGREPEHLIPPWLAVPLAFALGLGGLVIVLMPSTMVGHVYGAGTSVVFLGYAVHQTWRWLARRRTSR